MSKSAKNDDIIMKKKYSFAKTEKNKKREDTKRNNKKRAVIKNIIFLSTLILAVYFAGVLFYGTHFCPGTKIRSVGCSNMTIEQAVENISESVSNYKLVLYTRSGKEEIYGSDIGLVLNSIGNIEEVKSRQNRWLWFYDKKGINQDINIDISFDEELLDKKVKELDCVAETKINMSGMSEKIQYSETEKKYVLDENYEYSEERAEADNKNIVDRLKLYECVNDSIVQLKRGINIDRLGCYVRVSQENTLNNAIDTANSYVSAKVTYLNDAGEYVTMLDGGSVHTWISIDNDFNVNLDGEQLQNYVKELSARYNTIGKSRSFMTSNGNEITVSGGDYGWKMDCATESVQLEEIIKKGETVERVPEFSQKAKFAGVNDIGNTYAEVSISGQHIWFYKDGNQIISSDVVTGNPNRGNGTGYGVFRLKYKERNATLVGADYRTPVSFWMPFNGGQGLHDAGWRGAFGGSIYLSNGSHGCVNLPPNVAATIFENISPGDPVVIY